MVASLFQICLCFCRVGLYFNDVLLVPLFHQCFFLIFLSVFPLQWEMNFCCILNCFSLSVSQVEKGVYVALHVGDVIRFGQ